MKWRALALSVLASVVLAACGGGNDDNSPAPAAPTSQTAQTASLRGLVIDADKKPLPGVTVSAGEGHTATTGADGSYELKELSTTALRTVVQFDLAGYARQTSVTDLPVNTAGLRLDAVMPKVATTVTFAKPSEAQTLSLPAFSKPLVEFKPESLVRADGGSVASKTVTAELTVIDPSADLARMPGNYTAGSATSSDRIESFGAIQVTLKDNTGFKVNLKKGSTATIRIPAVKSKGGAALPASVPLYSFNESSGYWEKDGVATLVPDAVGTQAYYVGEVKHFSTWNADQPIETVTLTGCVKDKATRQPVTSGALVVAAGGDYLGTNWTAVDSQGNFSIQVKKGGVTQLQAASALAAGGGDPIVIDAAKSAANGSIGECLWIVFTPVTVASYAGNYTGTFAGTDTGTFEVTIGSNGQIAGKGQAQLGGPFGISGAIAASGQVSLQGTLGSAGVATFSGTVNVVTGALDGTWSVAAGGGTYTGKRE